jgi:Domain of unknown function (DUF4136)
MTMNYFRFLILSSLLALAACSQTLYSDVVRFHTLPAPSGESFIIVPLDEEMEAGPEFRSYASEISTRLLALGYTLHEDPDEPADLKVSLGFSVREEYGRYRYQYWRQPYFFGFGFGLYNHGYHFAGQYDLYGYGYRPFGGFDPYYYSASYNLPRFARMLEMVITTRDDEILFEGRAVSRGRNDNMPEIIPLLAMALFDEFPGESGVTSRVGVDRVTGTIRH